jgi:hypothetical protein
MDQTNTTSQKSDSPPAAPAQAAPAINMAQLTERVYRLMREDLRLEQARGVRVPRRKAR